MTNETIRQLCADAARHDAAVTVGDYIKRKPTEDFYIPTFSGLHKVEYVRWPDTDPWVVTGSGLNQSSWCVHYGTTLIKGSFLTPEIRAELSRRG